MEPGNIPFKFHHNTGSQNLKNSKKRALKQNEEQTAIINQNTNSLHSKIKKRNDLIQSSDFYSNLLQTFLIHGVELIKGIKTSLKWSNLKLQFYYFFHH